MGYKWNKGITISGDDREILDKFKKYEENMKEIARLSERAFWYRSLLVSNYTLIDKIDNLVRNARYVRNYREREGEYMELVMFILEELLDGDVSKLK